MNSCRFLPPSREDKKANHLHAGDIFKRGTVRLIEMQLTSFLTFDLIIQLIISPIIHTGSSYLFQKYSELVLMKKYLLIHQFSVVLQTTVEITGRFITTCARENSQPRVERWPEEPFPLLISCVRECFLFRMLLRFDISSYILIPTTVTTTYKPRGQEATSVWTKQASQRARFMMVEYWSLRQFKSCLKDITYPTDAEIPKWTCAECMAESEKTHDACEILNLIYKILATSRCTGHRFILCASAA